jgi:hypothetical protein
VSTDQHGQFDDGVEQPRGGVSTDQHGQFDDGVVGAAKDHEAKAADDTFVGEAEPKRSQE